ncbi:hypothetical protein AB6A40_002687 [Gnathostoma spinigerum]|uniref:F-box domain-containing protein n=1 Tax=Gnathostoma spinigerum TaxID=75299 RepID=A0ABD6E7F4_9BILA
MEGYGSLSSLLADLQACLCENFSEVECSIDTSPDLREPPFSLDVRSFGSKVHLQPIGTPIPSNMQLLTTLSDGLIVTDGLQTECIRLILAVADDETVVDWRSPLISLFTSKFGKDWAFVVAELRKGKVTFYVLTPKSGTTPSKIDSAVIWMVPLKTEAPPNVKLVKKVFIKKSVAPSSPTAEKSAAPTSRNTQKIMRSASGTRIVRKKAVPTTKETNEIESNNTTSNEKIIENGSAKKPPTGRSDTAIPSVMNSGESRPQPPVTVHKDSVLSTGGDGDSGISLADSDTEKPSKSVEASAKKVSVVVPRKTTPTNVVETTSKLTNVSGDTMNGGKFVSNGDSDMSNVYHNENSGIEKSHKSPEEVGVPSTTLARKNQSKSGGGGGGSTQSTIDNNANEISNDETTVTIWSRTANGHLRTVTQKTLTNGTVNRQTSTGEESNSKLNSKSNSIPNQNSNSGSNAPPIDDDPTLVVSKPLGITHKLPPRITRKANVFAKELERKSGLERIDESSTTSSESSTSSSSRLSPLSESEPTYNSLSLHEASVHPTPPPLITATTSPSKVISRTVSPLESSSSYKFNRSNKSLNEIRSFAARPMRNPNELPVSILVEIFKKCTYKELGKLREVHPHWDELCGQTLNTGYYELVRYADKFITDCQRRLSDDPTLQIPLTLLTNMQVHILNPVDVLRAAMDEGVCCFPYGDLLDKTYELLWQAKAMIDGGKKVDVDWKTVAALARKAQLHYKLNLEPMMEEKMSELIQMKALEKIQRIDSFIMDSTVSKLEKAAQMTRDDIEWEIEQLRSQNAQLRKDNRELRKDYMKLEARVEIMEGKFRTMARIFQ